MSSAHDLVVHAVGDLFVNRPDPDEAFELVRGVLDAADVVFGNCEVPFSREPAITEGTTFVADAAAGAGLRGAGFTVLSCANNHVTDAGEKGLATTLDVLHGEGIATAGAGANLAEARRPAVLTGADGSTVAVLAYACYYRYGTEATDDRPGVVTVGGETRILDTPQMCSPGIAPLVASTPNQAEADAMVHDIEQVKQHADVVLASFHWGDAVRPSVLSDHEQRIARLAIDAGADAVVGHHHHVLRGVDLHRGRPIFYGLGNFVWDAPEGWADTFPPAFKENMRRYGKYGLRARPGYPRLPFHPDGRMTMIARSRFRAGELCWVGFVPCAIRPDGRVEALDAASDEGQRVVAFVQEHCDDLEMDVRLEPDPSERVGGLTAVRISGR